MLLVHGYRSGPGFLVIGQVRFLALAGKEQGRGDGRPDEREGHPVRVGERVRGLGQALADVGLAADPRGDVKVIAGRRSGSRSVRWSSVILVTCCSASGKVLTGCSLAGLCLREKWLRNTFSFY